MSRRFALALALALGALACSPTLTPLVDCGARGDAEPLCGYQNPEDLALLPSGRRLLVSEYGKMDAGDPGFLSRLDLDGDRRTELFRGGDAAGASAVWGEPDCPGPPEVFSPHGIDLVERSDGRHALLVVNHAGRESVEFFEVIDPRGAATVAWRGCAVPPEGSWLNDVEARKDGSFLVSHMMPMRGPVGQVWELLKAALLQVESGHVIAWSREDGYSVVPGSAMAFANGIALSADETRLYVNSSIGGFVRALELPGGRLIGEGEIATPDNSTWASDGRLWVASLTAPTLETQACNDLDEGACPASFEIVALDPESFATEVVYASDGETMGAGTVGLQVGDALYVGTFAGDRILRVRNVAGRK